MGFWDDLNNNYYVMRPKILECLIQLSYDFRIVGVSCQKKKKINPLIYGLMNIPVISQESGAGPQGNASTNNFSQCKVPVMKHFFFDAVYQLKSENMDVRNQGYLRNIDEIHFDLSQVLIDMQFSRPDIETKN